MELMERAADLGSFYAFVYLVSNRVMEPPERAKFFVSFYNRYSRLAECKSDLEAVFLSHDTDGSCRGVIFEVGEVVIGDMDVSEVERELQNQSPDFRKLLFRAVTMHVKCCDEAREACVTWILIARRMRFNKDMRIMIAKIVWETRREG